MAARRGGGSFRGGERWWMAVAKARGAPESEKVREAGEHGRSRSRQFGLAVATMNVERRLWSGAGAGGRRGSAASPFMGRNRSSSAMRCIPVAAATGNDLHQRSKFLSVMHAGYWFLSMLITPRSIDSQESLQYCKGSGRLALSRAALSPSSALCLLSFSFYLSLRWTKNRCFRARLIQVRYPSPALVDADVVFSAVVAGGTDASSAPAAAFFSLALLLRLFWLCALDAPADAGYHFFRDLNAGIERALGECPPALGAFLRAVGPDVEERFMRSLGYMLAKWCLLREMHAAGSAATKPAPQQEPGGAASGGAAPPSRAPLRVPVVRRRGAWALGPQRLRARAGDAARHGPRVRVHRGVAARGA
ncbi:uncharacterized protein C2845_PM16G07330 [Panicum miliaceum]|uniref:Uncharacterized protein n=1 Tax=Panicum miliaceum TaxID=4540 RepID=A0A3L6PZF9_PANMI|nr:uncharacterized protein C2845_PM16G07330 [Panicum miliaceum]